MRVAFYHGGEPIRVIRPFLEGGVEKPYLLAMTLVSLYGGILNALQRFAAAAAAPVLLNLSMMATLAFAASFTIWPTPTA